MSAQPLAGGTVWADAARTLAARLASLAGPDADGSPAWVGDELDPVALAAGDENPGVVTGRLDDGLLTGRAGIALALAACSWLPGGDPRWAAVARRAASAAVRASAVRLPGGPLGWDSGALGVARAAVVVAGLTGDSLLRVGGERLASAAVAAVADGTGVLPPWPDLLGGVAGVLAGVAVAPLPPEDEPRRAEAVLGLVDRLDGMALEDAAGVRWLMATAGHPVAGLAHGASGIALALRLGARVLEGGTRPRLRLVGADGALPAAERARQLALGALRWEEGLPDAATGGWPDLRDPSRPPALAWCHGAPGIGVCAALTAASGPGTREGAQAHALYLRAARASRWHRPRGEPFDGTVCHGLAGVVELHLLAAQAWPDAAAEHLRLARSVAEHLVRAGERGRPAWTCGVPGGRTPNLLVGVAGVALTLARCHDRRIAPSPADPTLGWR